MVDTQDEVLYSVANQHRGVLESRDAFVLPYLLRALLEGMPKARC